MSLPHFLAQLIVPVFKPIHALSHSFKDSSVLKFGQHVAFTAILVYFEFSMRRIASRTLASENHAVMSLWAKMRASATISRAISRASLENCLTISSSVREEC